MKNTTVCKNCGTENPFYSTACQNCKSYLRGKIFNIDLGFILARIIDSPLNAFKQIILSEHKNFLSFFILISAFKFFLDSRFLSLAFNKGEGSWNIFILNFLITAGAITIFVFLFSLALKHLNKIFGLETRIKDYFALIEYSFIPHIFALLILLPIEFIVFGGNLFSNNPSPFVLKSTVATILLIFEGLIILWSIFLNVLAFLSQTKNIENAIVTSLIFNIGLYYIIYFLSIHLFN